jgi:hypothetical protein
VVVVNTYRPSPYFYRYYDPFYYGHWWYPSPPFGPSRAYYGGAYYDRSAVRLQVAPRDAEVFVDGYLAGRVDDFDGVFQRLQLPPGDHEIVLYLNGYRTVRQQVYLAPDSTFRIRYTMEPLQPGETAEPRPMPPQGPPRPPFPPGPRQGPPPVAQAPGDPSIFGTLAIRAQPADAEVLIDGEPWQAPDAQDRLLVQVAEGTHRVEIRRAGYDAYVRDVQVRRGETTTLNVSLAR